MKYMERVSHYGFTMTHDMWIPWVEDLQKDYKVITVDMRGHGRSTNPSNKFTHRESAEDIYGLLDKLDIDKFNAMGWSSGGMTLTHMATMDSARIKSLILIGSTSYFPEVVRQFQRSVTYENYNANHQEWMDFLRSIHLGGEDQLRNLLEQFHCMANSYDDMNFTPPYLSTIKCPTLIIHGDRDPNFSVDIPVTSYNAIPESYLWIIPNYGHSVPERGTALGNLFLETITNFISGKWKE